MGYCGECFIIQIVEESCDGLFEYVIDWFSMNDEQCTEYGPDRSFRDRPDQLLEISYAGTEGFHDGPSSIMARRNWNDPTRFFINFGKTCGARRISVNAVQPPPPFIPSDEWCFVPYGWVVRCDECEEPPIVVDPPTPPIIPPEDYVDCCTYFDDTYKGWVDLSQDGVNINCPNFFSDAPYMYGGDNFGLPTGGRNTITPHPPGNGLTPPPGPGPGNPDPDPDPDPDYPLLDIIDMLDKFEIEIIHGLHAMQDTMIILYTKVQRDTNGAYISKNTYLGKFHVVIANTDDHGGVADINELELEQDVNDIIALGAGDIVDIAMMDNIARSGNLAITSGNSRYVFTYSFMHLYSIDTLPGRYYAGFINETDMASGQSISSSACPDSQNYGYELLSVGPDGMSTQTGLGSKYHYTMSVPSIMSSDYDNVGETPSYSSMSQDGSLHQVIENNGLFLTVFDNGMVVRSATNAQHCALGTRVNNGNTTITTHGSIEVDWQDSLKLPISSPGRLLFDGVYFYSKFGLQTKLEEFTPKTYTASYSSGGWDYVVTDDAVIPLSYQDYTTLEALTGGTNIEGRTVSRGSMMAIGTENLHEQHLIYQYNFNKLGTVVPA